MDDTGKKLFDARGPSADFFGPAPIRLYSPHVAEHMGAVIAAFEQATNAVIAQLLAHVATQEATRGAAKP